MTPQEEGYLHRQQFDAHMRQQEGQRLTIVPMGRYQTVCATWFTDTQGRMVPSVVVKSI